MYCALWGVGEEDPTSSRRQWLERYAGALRRSLARATRPCRSLWTSGFSMGSRSARRRRRIYPAAVSRSRRRPRGDRGVAGDNPRENRPPHDYTLETFGYTREVIEREFAGYRARFIVKRGDSA